MLTIKKQYEKVKAEFERLGNLLEKQKESKYCTDKTTMERIAEKGNLMRELERFRDEKERVNVVWGDDNVAKYFIYYQADSDKLDIDFVYSYHIPGKVYFATRACAEAAIEKFGDRIKAVMVGDCK